jgi:tetratricopeptide (TPR) repeat protein
MIDSTDTPPIVDTQLTAQLLDQILAKAHPLLVEALYCAAVSHAYDVGMFAALRAQNDGRDERLAARVAEFSFIRSVEPTEPGQPRYAMLSAERAILRQRLIATNPALLVTYHQRALAYHTAHPSPDAFLHDQSLVYHSLIANPDDGANRLIALFRRYADERRLAAIDRLVSTARESRATLAALNAPQLADLDDLLVHLSARLAQLRGNWADSLDDLQSLHAKRDLPPRLRPYVARAYGEALAKTGQYVEAIAQYELALAAFRTQPDADGEQALTMLSLGDAHVDLAVSARGEREIATPRSRPQTDRWRWLIDLVLLPAYLPLLIYLSLYFGRRVYRSRAWHILGRQDWIIARLFGVGMRWYRRADRILDRVGTGSEPLRADEKIATLFLTMGDAHEAAPRFQALLDTHSAALGEYRRAVVQAGLGQAYLRLNDYASARDQLQAAMPVLEAYGDIESQALVIGLLAEANLHVGDRSVALTQLGRAMRLYQKQGDLVGATEVAERLNALDREQGFTAEERALATTTAGELTRRKYLVRFQHPILRWFRRSSLLLLAFFMFFIPVVTIFIETGSPIAPIIRFRASPLLDPNPTYTPTLTQGITLNVQATDVNATFAVQITLALFLLYLVVYTALGVGVIARTRLRTVQAAQAKAVQFEPTGLTLGRGAAAHTLRWPDITRIEHADVRPLRALLIDQSRTLVTGPAGPIVIEGDTANYAAVCARLHDYAPRAQTIDLSSHWLRSRLGAIYLLNLLALAVFITLGAINSSWLTADWLGTPFSAADVYPFLYLGIVLVPAWWLIVRPLRVLMRFEPRHKLVWLIGGIGVALAIMRVIALNTTWARWLTRPDLYPPLIAMVLMGSALIAVWQAREHDRPAYPAWLRIATAISVIGLSVIVGGRAIIEVVAQVHVAVGNDARDRGLAAQAADQPDQATREYEEAINAYSRALMLFPQQAGALDSRAALLAELGRFDAAIADYDAALNYTSATARVLVDRALTNERWGGVLQAGGQLPAAQQKLDAAQADFDRAIALNPRNASYYLWRGIAHHALGEIEAALADYEMTLRLNPFVANAFAGRGWVYFRQGADASRAAAQTTDNAAKKQLAASATKYFTQSLQDFQNAVRLDVRSADNWLALGYAQYRLGNYTATLEAWDKAVALAPNDPAILISRGTVHWKIGNTPSADRCADATATTAEKTVAAQQLQLAIDDFNRALASTPDDAFTYRTRAQVEYLLRNCPGFDFENQVAAAIASYDQAVKYAPDNFVYWQYRARLGYTLGLHVFRRGPENDAQARTVLDTAITDIRHANALQPDDGDNKVWLSFIVDEAWGRFYLQRGWDSYQAGRYTASISDSLTAANLLPKNSATLFNAGLAALALNDRAHAAQWYDAAIQRAIDNRARSTLIEAGNDLKNLLKTRSDLAVFAQPILKRMASEAEKMK